MQTLSDIFDTIIDEPATLKEQKWLLKNTMISLHWDEEGY